MVPRFGRQLRIPAPRLNRARRTRVTVLSALVALACAACTPSVRSTATSASARHVVAVVADHDCVVAGQGSPVVDWSGLHNPVLASPTAGEKDEALTWFAGRWHMLFSYVRYDRSSPGGVYWDIASATSTDLRHWTDPVAWPRQPGLLGVASSRGGPGTRRRVRGDVPVGSGPSGRHPGAPLTTGPPPTSKRGPSRVRWPRTSRPCPGIG